MATSRPGKSKRGVHGSSRRPGPIGIEFDELLGHHNQEEHSDDILDPTSNDWVEVFSETGFPQRVFYRGSLVEGVKPDAPLQIDFSIQVLHMDSRGNTSSKLYLEFGVFEQTKGRFIAFVSKATMVSVINVRPRSRFDQLADFKPDYDEFLGLIASTGSRSKAFHEFARRHVIQEDDHLSTNFTGKRGKTVEHEVHHLRYSQEKAEILLKNMVDEIKTEGKRSLGTRAWPRVRRIVESMSPGWDADKDDIFHRKIAEHDCLVMIAIYEAFALSPEEARAAGNNEPIPGLIQMLDYLTLDLMQNIGEPVESWGE